MRVWDVEPASLCDRHLLGQHNEIHGLWTIISQGRVGYSNHPETKRWTGSLGALNNVHDATAEEMIRRGFNHRSPLEGDAGAKQERPAPITPIHEQIELLGEKHAAGMPLKGVTQCGVG